jgi:S-DNA-T family DNA segregation ATPase FtsK/SpoIIIE
MTEGFLPVVRRLPPAVATTDIAVEAPPALPPPRSSSPLALVVPVGMSLAMIGVMAAAFFSGTAVTRNPMYAAFPMMTLISMAVTVAAGPGRRQGGDIDTDRLNYLGYLSRLRTRVSEIAAAQRFSLVWTHPDPATLWTLIGGPRMWERRASDGDFCLVRVGIGTQPLASRLVVPDPDSRVPSDPVTATALRRFVHTYSTLTDAPITIDLRGAGTVTFDGDLNVVRGLLRAMICQLAVLHPPDQLLIVGAVSDRNRAHWDWLKWLPHNQHPGAFDAVGSARMVYQSVAEAQLALTGAGPPHVVVVAALNERVEEITGATILEVGTGCDGAPLAIRRAGDAQSVPCPDQLDPIDALVCARRLAMHRTAAAGLGDVTDFDPVALWRG